MRKLTVTFLATAALVLAGSLAFKADAQTSRGAGTLPAQAQNFTPIEKAACGPFWGRRCGPFHHWVCGPYGRRCWCARC
jgi:Spy/CpxP family protein refolding chaperone